ncbi:MAG: membrane dipeptidase [Bacteroidales bacterium]|nr:membrane dipeptidase [Bacteroidales bacterium]
MTKITPKTSKLQFADLHLHSTLRPFAQFCVKPDDEKASIWYQDKAPDNPSGRAKNYTQSDFTSLTQGGVKLAFTAMYPIEQGWFDILEALGITSDDDLEMILNFVQNKKSKNKHPIFGRLEKVLEDKKDKDDIIDEIIAIIGHFVTSLPVKRIREIIEPTYNYYEALKEELNYLENQCNSSGKKAVIPENRDELLTLLDDDETIVVIPTIEGGASFVGGNAETIENKNLDFSQIKANIREIKTAHKVFFVTLSHHFYNGFNGHAQSVYGTGRVGVDQMLGKGNIITENGWEIVRQLLSIGEYKDKNEGKRILIDTKHLSVPARIEYYNFIAKYNAKNPSDNIPIISSHSAFSGINKIEDIGANSGYYSEYEVNIAEQEVEAIYNSKGLIGLNFDQNVLSKKPKNAGKKATKNWSNEEWAQLFVDNLLGMVEAFAAKKDSLNINIWDIFTIGSDFDGFIDPTNSFATAVKLPLLKATLIEVLGESKKFKELSFGLSAETVVEKFMGQNAIEFIKRNYWKREELSA